MSSSVPEVRAGSVAVNSAFLQEIKDDHVELTKLLEKTERAFEQQMAQTQPRELVYLLLSLQERLAIHFSLEESFGYCQEALQIAPRLSQRATELLAEHHRLLADICALASEAEQLLAPIPVGSNPSAGITVAQVEAHYRAFKTDLTNHENRESELILAAYDDDVGGEG